MFILKKIIIKEWIKFFFGAFFVLMLLLSIGYLLGGLLKPNVKITEVFIGLAFELPLYLNKTFPISCLMATLFSVNKLKNTNELTAIFATGYSRKDYLQDIISVSLIVSLVLFWVSSYFVPYVKSKRSLYLSAHSLQNSNSKNLGLSSSTINSGKIWFKSTDYFFSYSYFDKNKNELIYPSLYFFDNNSQFIKKVTAKSAIASGDHEWKFTDVEEFSSLSGLSYPKISNLDSSIITINESLSDFKQINADISTLNIVKLYEYILILKSAGINVSEYTIFFLDKFSTSFMCIILSLVSSVGIFNSNRRNASFGKNVTFVLVFTIFYWLIYSYTFSLGVNSRIPPIVATFGVPSLFVFFLLGFFIHQRKLR